MGIIRFARTLQAGMITAPSNILFVNSLGENCASQGVCAVG